LDCLLQGNESQAINIISNLLFSTIPKERILFNIILPSLNTLNDMYNRGKISETEKLLISTTILDLILMTKFVSTLDTPKLKASSIVVSGSEEANYFARIASVVLYLIGWNSLYLGNVEFIKEALLSLKPNNAQGELYFTDCVSYGVQKNKKISL